MSRFVNLYIPSIGSEIKLSRDWSLQIEDENRNHKMIQALGFERVQGNCVRVDAVKLMELGITDKNSRYIWPPAYNVNKIGLLGCTAKSTQFIYNRLDIMYRCEFNVTLPTDTVLKIDRIYIRKGKDDYDSITFVIQECSEKALKKKRFWCKLHYVNEIACEILDD